MSLPRRIAKSLSLSRATLLATAMLWPSPALSADGERDQLTARMQALLAKAIAPEREITDLQADVDKALAGHPSDPELLYWRAELIGRNEKPVGAAAAYQQALAAARKPPRRDTIAALCLCALAREELANDRSKEAEAFAREAKRIEPVSIEAHRILLDCYLRHGNPLDLVAEFRQSAEKHGADKPELESLYFELLATVGDWISLERVVVQRLAANPQEADARHYRGKLAQLRGNEVEAFVQHCLALELGLADRPTMVQSRIALESFSQKMDEDLPQPLRELVIAYRDSTRKSEAKNALVALANCRLGNDPDARIVAGLLELNALGQLGKHADSVALVERLRREVPQWKDGSSMLVLWGEALEAMNRAKEAEPLFERARQQSPGGPAVRRIFRLGGKFRAIEHGVEVTAIEPRSPLELAGVAVGDTLLELDRELLGELSVHDRLRAVRLYFGGIITLRTKHGEVARREMDLIYFRN